MKLTKSTGISLLLMLTSLFSCSVRKSFKIVGFAYNGDSVIILQEDKVIFNIQASEKLDKNGICSFYKNVDMNFGDKDIAVRVIIDSNNLKILDKVVIIPKNNKEPFISFLYPDHNRSIFIGDATKSPYIKY